MIVNYDAIVEFRSTPASQLYIDYVNSLQEYWYIHALIIIITGFIANETKFLNIIIFSISMLIFVSEVAHYFVLFVLYLIFG